MLYSRIFKERTGSLSLEYYSFINAAIRETVKGMSFGRLKHVSYSKDDLVEESELGDSWYSRVSISGVFSITATISEPMPVFTQDADISTIQLKNSDAEIIYNALYAADLGDLDYADEPLKYYIQKAELLCKRWYPDYMAMIS